MKNFYNIRDCPYPPPTDGDTIGYDRITAESWDIKYIMQANKNLPCKGLHKHKDGSLVYVDASDYHTFNMLDAFDIPHLNRNDITVVLPQVVANKNGSRSVIIHKNTQDVKGPASSTLHPSQHHDHAVDNALNLPIRAIKYTIRIGKYLLSPNNKLTVTIKRA